jgi:hypothetical protein
MDTGKLAAQPVRQGDAIAAPTIFADEEMASRRIT